MATKFNLDTEKAIFIDNLRKAVQSSNLNFLVGAGCSVPAIAPLGNIELEIQAKIDGGNFDESEKLIFDFLKPFLDCSIKMKTSDTGIKPTLENYKALAANLGKILFERKSNILPKRANIFSTNYDLFVEQGFEDAHTSIRLNDGFCRTPSPWKNYKYSSSEFFNSVSNDGHFYNYEVKVPTINLIKLHGSLNWQSNNDEIVYSTESIESLGAEHSKIAAASIPALIKAFNKKFSVVLPRTEKFKDSLLNQTYYELLRVFANEMDRENTLLIAEGFSFADAHLLKITERALKNPTLKIVVFCYSKTELGGFESKFELFNNVEIIYSEKEDLSFKIFSSILAEILPVPITPEYNTAHGLPV